MRYLHHANAFLVGSALVAFAHIARAQDEQHKEPAIPQVSPTAPSAVFGGKGQIALASDNGLMIANTSRSGGGGSSFTFTFQPSVDWFVIDNFSVGAFVGLAYTSVDTGHTTAFHVGPRVGYNIPLSHSFSVWPKAGVSVSTNSQTFEVAGRSDSSSDTNFAINLYIPLMFHPVEHFFVGFGPALDADLSGDQKATTIAGLLTLGGWLQL